MTLTETDNDDAKPELKRRGSGDIRRAENAQ